MEFASNVNTSTSFNSSYPEIIRALSGLANSFTIPRLYVKLTGCHARALILGQLIFWSDKSSFHEDGWFHKSYKAWTEETEIQERTLRRIFEEFKSKGWCQTKTIKVLGVRTLLLRPNFIQVLSDIQKLLANPDSSNQATEPPTGQNVRMANRTKCPFLYIQIKLQLRLQILTLLSGIHPDVVNQRSLLTGKMMNCSSFLYLPIPVVRRKHAHGRPSVN